MSKPVSISPLFRLNQERQTIIDEVIERVTRRCIQASWDDPGARLDNLLNEAAFVELSRHAAAGTPHSHDTVVFWHEVVRAIARSTEEENAELIRRAVTAYVHDIAGNFRPTVQRLALGVLPRSLSLMLGATHGGAPFSRRALEKGVAVEGDIARIRKLAEVGTLVFVSTHASRMDAGLLGYAMHLAGLPPLVHGADRTLFQNPLTSFFMTNLGAYKVDRKRNHTLYKRTLKCYSQVILERGYHSFFFPTGGRSRSNRIEQHLKLGLMGTALNAWSHTVTTGESRPVFIIPMTLNYTLVLEAETLAADHIAAPRAHTYDIIEKDEFSQPRRVAAYLGAALSRSPFLTVRFGRPMDPFGNAVSEQGASLDRRGRIRDPRRYLWRDGIAVEDAERAHAYTRGLGREVIASWRENNVIAPIHIVSMALFEYVCRQHPSWDVHRLLWFARGDTVSRAVAEGETERVVRLVRRDAAAGRLCLTERAQSSDAHAMLDDALHLFGAYHSTSVVEDDPFGPGLVLSDLRLLYFYSNRLRGYDLERRLGRTPGGY